VTFRSGTKKPRRTGSDFGKFSMANFQKLQQGSDRWWWLDIYAISLAWTGG
jgi:hypothetical protein